MSNRKQLEYLLTKALLYKAILQKTFAQLFFYILRCKKNSPSPSVTSLNASIRTKVKSSQVLIFFFFKNTMVL